MKGNIPVSNSLFSSNVFISFHGFFRLFLNFELHYKNEDVEGKKTQLVLK